MSTETRKAILEHRRWSLHLKYLHGAGLAIGAKGYTNSTEPEITNAINLDLDYPDYDGITLPFADNSQDFVYSSHVLEHIEHVPETIREWFRVLKPGGYMFIVVPHAYLYERASDVTHITISSKNSSQWNGDHWRAYTPGNLIGSVDYALKPNTWRLRHCADNDYKYDYAIQPQYHPGGAYEIECVIEKLKYPPTWEIR